MRKILGFTIFLTMTVLSACESEICVQCTQINGSDVQNFCSKEVHERNDFMVEWIHNDYSCTQVENQN